MIDRPIQSASIATVTSLSATIRLALFGISPAECSFDRRGFAARDDRARRHLENVGAAFVFGYRSLLAHDDAAAMADALDAQPDLLRGFAWEGAAMAAELLDTVTPWNRRRLTRLLEGRGADHSYMLHVGAGWAMARLRRGIPRALAGMDPLLRWLAVDGYGFHEGFFHHDRVLPRPQRRFAGAAGHAFDQGLGRSLWFVRGADPQAIGEAIAALPAERHADMWSGVGLAAAYAGGVSERQLRQLVHLAGEHHPELAQGVAFAACARTHAANLVEHTEQACQVVCSASARRVSAIVDDCRVGLGADHGEDTAYERWRQRIAARFGAVESAA